MRDWHPNKDCFAETPNTYRHDVSHQLTAVKAFEAPIRQRQRQCRTWHGTDRYDGTSSAIFHAAATSLVQLALRRDSTRIWRARRHGSHKGAVPIEGRKYGARIGLTGQVTSIAQRLVCEIMRLIAVKCICNVHDHITTVPH